MEVSHRNSYANEVNIPRDLHPFSSPNDLVATEATEVPEGKPCCLGNRPKPDGPPPPSASFTFGPPKKDK